MSDSRNTSGEYERKYPKWPKNVYGDPNDINSPEYKRYPNNYGDYSPEREAIERWKDEERKLWNKNYSGEWRFSPEDHIRLHGMGVKYE